MPEEVKLKKCKALDTFEDTVETAVTDEATEKVSRSFKTTRYNKGETYAVKPVTAARLIKGKLLKAA